MTAHNAIRPSSTMQLPSRGGSHARDIEPAWLTRLLTRKSRKSQYLSVLDLETVTSYHTTELTVPPTTALLSERTPEIKPDTPSPRPSAPLAIPGTRNAKSRSKSKRRFSFTPRREEAVPTSPDKTIESGTQTHRKSSGAAYVPKHAASDFGRVAIPTTYRESVVVLYSSSSSSDLKQHRRHSKAGASSNSATAMAEFQRRRSSAVSQPIAPDGSTTSFEIAPTAATTWSRSGSNTSQRRPSKNDHLSRHSLVFMMTEEDDEDEEHAIIDVNDDIKEEEESDTLIVPCEENIKKTRQSSVFTMPEASPVNDDNKKPTSRSKRYSTLGHNLQVPQPAVALASSASSISSKRAQRGSFSQSRRTSRQQSTGEAMHSGNHEHTKGQRDSVIVSLGKRVSEYIKPTTMPDNQITVLPQISVSRGSEDSVGRQRRS